MRRLKREPNWAKEYPWAVNLAKIKRAHDSILADNDERAARGKQVLEGKEFEQAVIDHYTSHAGLVRGHENITIVGRRGLMKKNFAIGKTTTEVTGKDMTAGSGDEDDEIEEQDLNTPDDHEEEAAATTGTDDDDE